MKITIIGAGNIGSAVAACLAKGHLYNEKDIIISTPHTDKLENLHKQFPAIRIMTENQYAISEADIIILAVKPCIVDEVLSPLRFSRTQILVSLVTGISISHLAHLSETEMPIFRVVPNIAITELEPDPDNFTQSRQRTPATHKTDIRRRRKVFVRRRETAGYHFCINFQWNRFRIKIYSCSHASRHRIGYLR